MIILLFCFCFSESLKKLETFLDALLNPVEGKAKAREKSGPRSGMDFFISALGAAAHEAITCFMMV